VAEQTEQVTEQLTQAAAVADINQTQQQPVVQVEAVLSL
jgi:hypothetical protein